MPQPTLPDIRKDYRMASLDESDVLQDPFQQFDKWFEEALHSQVPEPNAMTLATASKEGIPSARIVLLKGMDKQGFYFYTNYESRKGTQLDENPNAALVFFWPALERQVRMEGTVVKASAAASDTYFMSRPENSRIGAWASPQSHVISGRAELEKSMETFRNKFSTTSIYRPPHWGGYLLQPTRVEFWQGRSNRLHDRILYHINKNGDWRIERLAP